jgi:hypothetical protein
MKQAKITIDYANALLQYLGTKPYVEVAGLIAELQKQVAPQLQQEIENDSMDN